MRDGKVTVYFRSSGTINPAQGQIVRQDLINLGFNADNIKMKGFSGGDIYTAMGVRGNDADIGRCRWVGARTIPTRTTG